MAAAIAAWAAAEAARAAAEAARAAAEAAEAARAAAEAADIDLAATVIPDWWGITAADMGTRRGITFRRVRRCQDNPGRTLEGVTRLMEKDELVGMLGLLGMDRGWRSKNKWQLQEHIITSLSLDQVTAGACRQLKVRAHIEQKYDDTAFGRTAFGGKLKEFRQHAEA